MIDRQKLDTLLDELVTEMRDRLEASGFSPVGIVADTVFSEDDAGSESFLRIGCHADIVDVIRDYVIADLQSPLIRVGDKTPTN